MVYFKIETGQVNVDTTGANAIVTVDLVNTYVNPVVVAYIQTRGGGQSVAPRVIEFTSTSFTVTLQEPGGGTHGQETISYMVAELGEWILPNGLHIKAGYSDTTNNHNDGSTYTYATKTFTTAFSAKPVVFASLMSNANTAFKVPAIHNVASTGFSFCQESAGSGTSTQREIVSWIVIEDKAGVFQLHEDLSVIMEVVQVSNGVNDGVDDAPHIYTFAGSYSSTPIVISHLQTSNGNDGAWARGSGTNSSTQHGSYSEEDQVGDTERSHTDEYFGFWVISEAFDLDLTPIETEEEDYIIKIAPVNKDVFDTTLQKKDIIMINTRNALKEQSSEVSSSDVAHGVSGLPLSLRFPIYGSYIRSAYGAIVDNTYSYNGVSSFIRNFYNKVDG